MANEQQSDGTKTVQGNPFTESYTLTKTPNGWIYNSASIGKVQRSGFILVVIYCFTTEQCSEGVT